MVMDIEDVLKRWEEYVKALFENDRGDEPRLDMPMEGHEILEEEVNKAIKTMKRGKSAGNDKITIEMLKPVVIIGERK